MATKINAYKAKDSSLHATKRKAEVYDINRDLDNLFDKYFKEIDKCADDGLNLDTFRLSQYVIKNRKALSNILNRIEKLPKK